MELVAGDTRARLFTDGPGEGSSVGRQSPMLRASASRALKVRCDALYMPF